MGCSGAPQRNKHRKTDKPAAQLSMQGGHSECLLLLGLFKKPEASLERLRRAGQSVIKPMTL
jgi:hypothetical protein